MSRHLFRQRIYHTPSSQIRHIEPRTIIIHPSFLKLLSISNLIEYKDTYDLPHDAIVRERGDYGNISLYLF